MTPTEEFVNSAVQWLHEFGHIGVETPVVLSDGKELTQIELDDLMGQAIDIWSAEL